MHTLTTEKELYVKDSDPLLHVNIGPQTWMPKNLNVNKFRNGDLIIEALTLEEWVSDEPRWCYYNFHPGNGKIYGKLYNWAAVNDLRGLAPDGWHIPSVKEWKKLFEYLGGHTEAGAAMKEEGTAHWAHPNTDANNSSHFRALPGGLLCTDKFFQYMHTYGFWWSKDYFEPGPDEARYPCYVTLNFESGGVEISHVQHNCGLSVRCIKDNHHHN